MVLGSLYIFSILIPVGDLRMTLSVSSDSISLSSFRGGKSIFSGMLTRGGDLTGLELAYCFLLTDGGDFPSSLLAGRFEYRVRVGGETYIRFNPLGDMLRRPASSDVPYLSFCGGMLYLEGRAVKGLPSGDESLNTLVLEGVFFLPSKYSSLVEKRRVFVGVKLKLLDRLGETDDCSRDLTLPELFRSFLVDSFLSRATFLSWYSELWKSPPIFTGFCPYTDCETNISVSVLAPSFQSTSFTLLSAIFTLVRSLDLFEE